jgi:diacylglycerol kinase
VGVCVCVHGGEWSLRVVLMVVLVLMLVFVLELVFVHVVKVVRCVRNETGEERSGHAKPARDIAAHVVQDHVDPGRVDRLPQPHRCELHAWHRCVQV